MKKILYIAAALAILASCTKSQIDDMNSPKGNGSLRISSSIEKVTRVTDSNTWEQSDVIGVFAYRHTLPEILAENSAYKSVGAGATVDFEPQSDDQKIYFPTAGVIDVVAFHPYESLTEPEHIAIDINSIYHKKNLLWASNNGVEESNEAVDLQFKYVFSKIAFSLTLDKSVEDQDEKWVSVNGFKYDANFILRTGEFEFVNGAQTSAFRSRIESDELTGKYHTDAEPIIPQNATMEILVTVGDLNFSLSLGSVEFEPGKIYNYNIEVAKDMLTLKGEPTITPWEEGEEENLTSIPSSGYMLEDFVEVDGSMFIPEGNIWFINDTNEAGLYGVDDFKGLRDAIREANNDGRKITLDFPYLIKLPSYALAECDVVGATLHSATEIGSNAFLDCERITTLSLPAAEKIGAYSFESYSALKHLNIGYDQSGGGNHATVKDISLNWFGATLVDPDLSEIELNIGYTTNDIEVTQGTPGTIAIEGKIYTFKSVTQAVMTPATGTFDLQTIGTANTSNFSTWMVHSKSNASGTELRADHFASLRDKLSEAHERGHQIELILHDIIYLPDRALENCNSLVSISLPTATTIGRSALSGCEELKTLSAERVTEIMMSALNMCEAITELNFPRATIVGESAFADCVGLTSLNIGYDKSGNGNHSKIGSFASTSLHSTMSQAHSTPHFSLNVNLFIGDVSGARPAISVNTGDDGTVTFEHTAEEPQTLTFKHVTHQ